MYHFITRHRGLCLALTVYLYFASLYFFLVPIFEGPDEWTHSGHVKFIAEGHGLPVMLPGQGIWGGQQPPLYYVGGALLMQPFDLRRFDDYDPGRKNPHASLGYALDPGNKNNYLHLADEAFPYHNLTLAVHFLRLYSIGYGLITLIFIYLTANDLTLTLVTLFAATQPMFTFITAMVANEPANMACCAVVIWLSQRYVIHGPSPNLRRAFALGVALGFVSLAKMTGLSVGLVAVVAFLQAAWSSRYHSRAIYWLWRDGFIITTCFMLIGGWWYWRNYQLYGDFFQAKLYEIYFHDKPDPITFDHFIYILRSGEVSFWATFGWLNIVAPSWVYQFYWFISRGGLLGLILAGLWHIPQNPHPNPLPLGEGAKLSPRIGGIKGGINSPYLLHLIFPVALAFSLTRLVAVEGGIQGRQLLPALGSIAILIMGGWQFWLKKIHKDLSKYLTPALSYLGEGAKSPPDVGGIKGGGHYFLIAALFSIALYLPLAVVAPAYIPPRLLTEADLPTTMPRLDWVYRDEMRLLGVTIETQTIRPGERVPITVYWQALRPITTNYSVFVHLIGRDYQTVGQFNSYPGLGLRPTSTLQPGQIFRDSYPVQVDGGAATPSRLLVNVGLFNFNEAGRPGIPALNPQGQPTDSTVGQLKLVPTTWPRSVSLSIAQYTDQINLLETTMNGCQQATAPCTLTFTWQAEGQPTTNYTVFIQLWQGDKMKQGFDAPPLNNDYPTSLWNAGEVIIDPHAIDLSALPPGDYTILTGLYDPQSGARLPLKSGRPDQAVEVGMIHLNK